ncbi:MAG TPA: PepSY-like domain-containing protein [Saprospiraceae bacterium]|jgi:hypothetical protein|nr:PepSY-like domain-containing protein [Saprospiraceae bacterium]HRO08043.1 PepSY-like domain-containing protein [Saprospiraceae bacterium]HRO72101.1 PepSY-like domain-containing protein [Saprospiraceae bacterium]HRP41370.1 PepSY-like domain-containing protein [Saprospiraceae bacterium]
MKKLIKGMLFVSFLTLFTACDKESVLDANKIPQEITNYINTHFTSHQILQVVEDLDGFTKTYDVVLDNNTVLEFNRKKEVTEIKSTSKLPDSVIPVKISQYVESNFPGNYINEWELEDKHQQVGIDNGLDLEFTLSGDFIRIDD